MIREMFTFSYDRKREAQDIVERCSSPRSALLPLLWLVKDQEGWVSEGAAHAVAEMVGMSPSEVLEVASFYSMFKRQPGAAYDIRVCTGLCCRMKGADAIIDHIEKKLEVEVGSKTVDGRFELSTTDCLGACDGAPAIMIGDDRHDGLTVEKVDEILRGLCAKT